MNIVVVVILSLLCSLGNPSVVDLPQREVYAFLRTIENYEETNCALRALRLKHDAAEIGLCSQVVIMRVPHDWHAVNSFRSPDGKINYVDLSRGLEFYSWEDIDYLYNGLGGTLVPVKIPPIFLP